MFQVIQGNSAALPLPDNSVDVIVTSPPYYAVTHYSTRKSVWGGKADCVHEWEECSLPKSQSLRYGGSSSRWMLRGTKGKDYIPPTRLCKKCNAWEGELGLEREFWCGSLCGSCYICHLMVTIREMHRVLSPYGTLWLNVGNSSSEEGYAPTSGVLSYLMQKEGWVVRSEIIWEKAVIGAEMKGWWFDEKGKLNKWRWKPIVNHEFIILAAKSDDYFIDHINDTDGKISLTTVWKITDLTNRKYRYKSAFPVRLPLRCISLGTAEHYCKQCNMPYVRAGILDHDIGWRKVCNCKTDDTRRGIVLDPFCGSGTTGEAALLLGRDFIGIDMNPEAVQLAEERLREVSAAQSLVSQQSLRPALHPSPLF